MGDVLNGVTLALNDRVFVWNQTAQEDNGVYVVGAVSPSRATDADTSDKLLGSIVTVAEGDEYADSVWLCSADAPITLGTDPLPWKLISLPPDANDGDSLIADASYPGGAKWSPANAVVSAGGGAAWIGPYTVPYTDVNSAPWDFSVGAARVDLFNLAPRSVIHACIAKTSVKFDSAFHNPWTLSGVGVAGAYQRYAGVYTISSTVSDTNFYPAPGSALTARSAEDWGAAKTISAWFYSIESPMTATQGSVDIWFLISKPPL